MFFCKEVWRDLCRHSRKTVIASLVSTALAWFLLLFSGSMVANQAQLDQLAEEFQLRLTFMNASGTQTTGLVIRDDKLQELEKSKLVTRGFYGALALVQDGSEDDGSFMVNSRWLTQLMAAYTDDSPLEGVSYFEGYDASVFQGVGQVCLMSREKYEALGLSPGQEYNVTLLTFKDSQSGIGKEAFYGGESGFQVVGTFEDAGEVFTGADISLVCPYESLRTALEAFNLHVWPSSAYLVIPDPENLNPLKVLLGELEISPVDSSLYTYGYKGCAAEINDSLYIDTAEPIQRTLALLEALYPMALLAVALLSLLSSYLLTQSRQEEFALERSMGVGKLRVFLKILTESGLLGLIGILMASVLFFAGSGVQLSAVVITALSCLGSVLAGGAVAAFLAARSNVLTVLASTR